MFPYMLHTIVTLLLCGLAFLGGVRVTERHQREKEAAIDHALEVQRADFRASIVPLTPARPYVPPIQEHGEFAERLEKNGSATIMFPGKHTAK